MSRRNSIKCEVFFIAVSFVFSLGCSQPDEGRLIRIPTEAHGQVVFGVTNPDSESVTDDNPSRIVLAIPTGQQRRRDVVRDIDSIWSKVAKKWNLTVICPASSSGIPFFSRDRGWFGHGAEVIIPPLLLDLRRRFGWNGGNLTLIDIGGNGGGSLGIVRQSPDSFGNIYVVPSFDVERDYFAPFLREEHDVDIVVVYGTQPTTKFEEWLSAQEPKENRVRVLRAPLDPLYRQGQTDGIDLFAEYAEFICGDLSMSTNEMK